MQRKKFRKLIKSPYDPVRIIFGNIYSKYKTNPINYDIAQINSILFNYLIPNSTQIIKALYKEMVLLCDKKEYIKYKYSYEESEEKLQIIGYIYVKYFKPPPNYNALDRNNQKIMFNLLKYKQELIDRYNYYKMQKNLKKGNIEDNEDNYAILGQLVYDSSDELKINNENRKESGFKNKPRENIINNIKLKSKKNVQFSKDNFNLKSFISDFGESKYESKVLSRNEPIEIKENEENKENSIESVQKLMDNFKKENNNDIEYTNAKNYKKFHKFSNSRLKYSSKNILVRITKKGFTGEMSINKKKIINLIKKNRYNFGKNNKCYLSIENFKEKLKENNKMKNSIEKYWKINKNFVTNLIENKSIKIRNDNFLKSSFPRFNYTSEDSTIKNDVNSEYFNYISLSTKAKISKINFNSKLPPLEKITNNNNIYSKKYKIKPIIRMKKNNISNSIENNNSQNVLMKLIQNNSVFMRNKKFKCIFSKSDKNDGNSTTINNDKKKKRISFNSFNNTSKNYFVNYKFRRKKNINSVNLRNKFDYFSSSSHSNENEFFKSL